jgi:hypothetical protein
LTAKGWTPVLHTTLVDVFARGMLSWIEMRIVSYILRESLGRWNAATKTHFVYTKPLTKYRILKECGLTEGWAWQVINRLLERKVLERSSKHGWRFNQDWAAWIPSDSEGIVGNRRHSKSEGNTFGKRRKYLRKSKTRKGFLHDVPRRSGKRYKPNNNKKHSRKGRDSFRDIIPGILRKRVKKITEIDPDRKPLSASMALWDKAKECPDRREGCPGRKKTDALYPICWGCANRKKRR